MEQTTTKQQRAFADPDIEKNHDIAAVSYIWIFSVLILIFRRESSFIRFHVRQGFVLFILSICIGILPWKLPYLNVFVFITMIIGFIQANKGEWYRIPVVADIADHMGSFKDAWAYIVFIFGKIGRFIQRLFTHTPVDVSSKKKGGSSVENQELIASKDGKAVLKKIQELEKTNTSLILLVEKLTEEVGVLQHLSGKNLQDLPKPIHVYIQKMEAILQKIEPKILIETNQKWVRFLLHGRVFFVLGGFEDNSCSMAFRTKLLQKEKGLSFENFSIRILKNVSEKKPETLRKFFGQVIQENE